MNELQSDQTSLDYSFQLQGAYAIPERKKHKAAKKDVRSILGDINTDASGYFNLQDDPAPRTKPTLYEGDQIVLKEASALGSRVVSDFLSLKRAAPSQEGTYSWTIADHILRPATMFDSTNGDGESSAKDGEDWTLTARSEDEEDVVVEEANNGKGEPTERANRRKRRKSHITSHKS